MEYNIIIFKYNLTMIPVDTNHCFLLVFLIILQDKTVHLSTIHYSHPLCYFVLLLLYIYKHVLTN